MGNRYTPAIFDCPICGEHIEGDMPVIAHAIRGCKPMNNDTNINLCPACVNDFIAIEGVDKLGTETEDLRLQDVKDFRYCSKKLCDKHKDRNQFEELRKALEATK